LTEDASLLLLSFDIEKNILVVPVVVVFGIHTTAPDPVDCEAHAMTAGDIVSKIFRLVVVIKLGLHVRHSIRHLDIGPIYFVIEKFAKNKT
jgi:hypothetical protein